ncbi:MAG TPA: zinc-ribbon and DUF3426 domain-containing protein [Rhodocyclaceae bacterium]
MLTHCPVCATTFRITPEQLKARQGRVRCGQCATVFNALEVLIDETPATAIHAPDTHEVHPPLHEEPSLAPAAPEPAEEPEAALADEDAAAESATPNQPAVTDAESATAEAAFAEAPVESAPAEPEDIAAISEPAPAPEAPAAMDFPLEPESATTSPAVDFPLEAEPEPVAVAAPEPQAELIAAPEPWYTPPVAARQGRRWPWIVGSLFAVLLLGLQALLHYRVEVAVLQPELKPALVALCAPLGCEVPLPHHADKLSIESSDLHPAEDDKGHLQLAAVLKNRAPFPQELPLLEVTLTDVADRALVVRALKPADYLPKGAPSQFPANGELNLTLTLDAGELPAAGYRLYLYYP